MKNKILILLAIVFFVISMILLNIFLNNKNEIEISSEEENNMEVMKITSENFEKEVLNSDKTVMVDFYADWCGPCKMLSPVVDSIANEKQDIKVVKIDVDNSQDLAIKYQVMSIPTIVIIKNGQEINRSVGVVSKTDLLEMVK